jgi:hypothetical protein
MDFEKPVDNMAAVCGFKRVRTPIWLYLNLRIAIPSQSPDSKVEYIEVKTIGLRSQLRRRSITHGFLD